MASLFKGDRKVTNIEASGDNGNLDNLVEQIVVEVERALASRMEVTTAN